MSEPQPKTAIPSLELERSAADWKQRYEDLIEGLPDALYIQDESGNFITANAAAERLSGFSRDELAQMNFRVLLAPDSYDRVMRAMEPMAQTHPIEAELLTRGGLGVPIDVHASARRGPGGEPALQILARENTNRRLFEEALRNTETTFRLMAKNLTEMVLAYDMKRRLIFANPAAEALTGYAVSELEREQFICWVHPEDRDRMLAHWDELFAGESLHEEEYRLITKDGRMKWVAASWGPVLDDAGRQVGVQGRERDITERRTAEETLRQSEHRLRFNEERYRTLFEASPFPMWEEDFSGVKQYVSLLMENGITDIRDFLDRNRDAANECLRRIKVLDINRAALDFYGAHSKQDLMGDLSRIFDERSYEVFSQEIAHLASSPTMFRSDVEARTFLGEHRTLTMIVSRATWSSDDWSRFIVSFFDITDRKRLEEQLLQSQKLDSLGRLAGGIAHDFNNLLMVINGYSDLLLSAPGCDNTIRLGLAEIKSAGERGAELTQQLLAFSRKQMAQPRILSLNAIIRESEGMLRRVIGEDINLIIRLEPDICNIRADRGQVHQVLMNLVVNSREAMPDGGTLRLDTANVSLGTDFQPLPEGSGARPYTRLRVQDTGAGMDERTMRHLFEPFFTTKSVSKGTGLGLATVFGIVKQSQGHIAVTSEPGSGSTFDVFFPGITVPTAPEPAANSGLNTPKGFGAVLVAEDQEEVRSLCCTILREAGYDVLEARDGLEALKLAKEYVKPIRLLLTDVIMPGINGRELSERLMRERPESKVLYMSGYTDRIMSQDGVLDDSVAYLQKPFPPARLIEMVQQILGSVE